MIAADSMEQPEYMYQFYSDQGINDVGLNVEEKEGINASTSVASSNLKSK